MVRLILAALWLAAPAAAFALDASVDGTEVIVDDQIFQSARMRMELPQLPPGTARAQAASGLLKYDTKR